MTAALELAGLSPELLEAIVAQVTAKLSLVVSRPALSMLAASKRRRDCERRQADAVRGDRSPDGLSLIPSTVRKRQWKRRQAAAKKAGSIPDRSPALEVQPVKTGEATAGGALRADRIPTGTHGPLAGDVASLIGRVTGYAESNSKRDRVWLYEEARRIWNEDLGLHLPSQWTGPKDWGACRALIRDYDREVLLKAVLEGGRAWKQAPGKWSRPTLGLVLHRLRLDSAAAAPTSAPKPDSRRMTGEQLEERDRARARAAAPAKPAVVVDPPVRGPAGQSTETRAVLVSQASETASGASGDCKNPGEVISRGEAPEQGLRGTIRPSPAGPLQLAEPSPTSSAEARDVLELVNATAARCRAFKTSPELRSKAAAARNGGPP